MRVDFEAREMRLPILERLKAIDIERYHTYLTNPHPELTNAVVDNLISHKEADLGYSVGQD